MKSIIWFIPFTLVFLGILLLSTVFSAPFQIEGVGYLDKLEHAFAYLVLTGTLLFGFHKNKMLSVKHLILLMISCAAYGVALEFVQFVFFPDRYFEWFDAGANVLGVLAGGISYRFFRNG